MLAPLDEPLPNCRLLATGEEFDDSSVFQTTDGPDRAEAVTLAALDELADLMESRGG